MGWDGTLCRLRLSLKSVGDGPDYTGSGMGYLSSLGWVAHRIGRRVVVDGGPQRWLLRKAESRVEQSRAAEVERSGAPDKATYCS